MKLFKEHWLNLLVSGILMLCFSTFIFGGLMYLFLTSFESWFYVVTLSLCGFSTLVSSVLMLYDSVKFKIKKEIGLKKKSRKKSNKQIEKHIKVLNDEAKRVKPESMRQ